MARNYFEDRMNDLYDAVMDGNVNVYYALVEYLIDDGFRDGLLGEIPDLYEMLNIC